MPGDADSAANPREWLRRARGDLALARLPKLDDILWEDLCFHIEQAVEKALKAVLVARSVEFPRTHNISVLLHMLDPSGTDLAPGIHAAATLTYYATQTRYPGEYEPMTEDDYREALSTAKQVVAWAEQQIMA